jgi:hypothetical protein
LHDFLHIIRFRTLAHFRFSCQIFLIHSPKGAFAIPAKGGKTGKEMHTHAHWRKMNESAVLLWNAVSRDIMAKNPISHHFDKLLNMAVSSGREDNEIGDTGDYIANLRQSKTNLLSIVDKVFSNDMEGRESDEHLSFIKSVTELCSKLENSYYDELKKVSTPTMR